MKPGSTLLLMATAVALIAVWPGRAGDTSVVGAAVPAPGAAAAQPWNDGSPSAEQLQDDGDDRDILKISLLTLAGVGGGAAFFTLAYLVRRRIGFDLHRPPEDGGDAETGH